MLKILICIGTLLIVLIITWFYKNRNLIQKVIECTWAHLCVRYGKVKEDKIDYNDLIEEKEITETDDDKPNGAISVLWKLLNDSPELAEAIKERNRKEAEKKVEDDARYDFPIKRSVAIEIAKNNNTLKTDFCRNSDRKGISFLGFNDYTINVIEKNEKKYWQFQVLSGDISWIIFDKDEQTYCDGRFGDSDINFLRCLIDVESGDYIYFPDVKKYEERTVNYEDAINEVVKIDEEPPEWLSRLEKEDKDNL